MKGWSTFFRVIAVLVLVVGLLSFVFNPIAAIGLLISSISFFFFSALCDRISRILENQEHILRRMDFLNQ